MKKFLLSGILFSGWLLAPGFASAQTTWHAETLTYGDRGMQMAQYWSKGRRLRAETVVGGHRTITIVTADTYYAIDAVRGRGLAIKRSPAAIAADRTSGRPFGLEGDALRSQGGEKVSEERIAGARCDLYRTTDSRGRREVCIESGGSNLPLRVTLFDRRSGTSVQTDYVHWLRDIEIVDTFFAPNAALALEPFEYQDYLSKTAKGEVDRIPILFTEMLHGPEAQ